MTGGEEAALRRLLNLVYASYADEPALAHMRVGDNPVVPGDGPMRPRLLFVGEAPSRNEARLRRPFVGASGRLLEDMLASVGIQRSEVFITNTVKYRPMSADKRNRTPTEEEKLASIPYLRQEMALLGMPPMVVLGQHAKHAMGYLPASGTQLGNQALNLRLGEWTTALGVPMLPLHHPSYGVYQQANKPVMFEMFKAVLNPPKA